MFAKLEESRECDGHNRPDLMREITLDAIVTSDVIGAIGHTKPSAHSLQSKYVAWQQEFESV